MSKTPENGAGWEIVRQYTDPEKALRAAAQVIGLIESNSDYVYSNGYSPPGSEDVDYFMLRAWSLSEYPDYPDTITSDTEQSSRVIDLLDIHRRAMKRVGRSTTSQINHYEVGGHTRWHRDRQSFETFAVALQGVGLLRLKDPATGEKIYKEIYPGDAFHLVNPRIQRMRPYHRVDNIGDIERIALVA